MNLFISLHTQLLLAILLAASTLPSFGQKNTPHKLPQTDSALVLLGTLTPYRTCFDVSFYDLNINLNAESKSIDGTVAITATAQTNMDTLQLDLRHNFTINSITNAFGEQISFFRTYDAVFVTFPSTIEQGSTFTLSVDYFGVPKEAVNAPWDGGFVWKQDAKGNVFAGVACQGEGASMWWPCKDHPADEPDSAQMSFTIPTSLLSVISNGKYVGSKTKKRKKTFTWRVDNPINVYDISFYLGNFKKLEDEYTSADGSKLHLEHYVLAENHATAIKHFPQVKKHIAAFEWAFGKYNWYNDCFKLVEAPYLGMEHQSGIAYGNHFHNDLYGKDDYIILHETGHEWFGNAITVDDYAHIWIQEGITTYAEALYLEHEYDKQTAQFHLKKYREILKNKIPVLGPEGIRFFDPHDGDVYFKGAWIVHTLRNYLASDSVFFEVMRTFYADFKGKTCNTQDFVTTVNKVTGKDYQWFFDQYLTQAELPRLEYYLDGNTMYYKMANVSDAFYLPIRVSGNKQEIGIIANKDVQSITISKPYFDETKVLYELVENKALAKKP